MYTDNDYRLYHHGVKGQKWGIMNGPPYPLDESISTGSRLRETAGRIKEHMKKRSEERAVKREERRVQKEEKKAQKFEEKKGKTLRSGDFNKVTKMRDDLTDDELRAAITRIRINQELESLEPKSHFYKTMDKVNDFRVSAEKGMNAWNTFAKAVNSFMEEPAVPVLDGRWGLEKAERLEKKEKELKREREEAAAAKARQREANFVRNASSEEFLKNANRMSDAALKSRAEREKNLASIQNQKEKDDRKKADKYGELMRYERRTSLNPSRLIEQKSVSSGKKSFEKNLNWLNDDDVEVITPSTSSRGTNTFNNAYAQIESQPIYLLEDKQRRAS